MKNKKSIVSLVIALALLISSAGLYSYYTEKDVASIVFLDVNPSIEIQVDKDANIVEAIALNDDAKVILEGMRLSGTDIITATNAIIGSLLKHGYINELANSILLTVEDDDNARGENLKKQLLDEINQILTSTSVNASVLVQTTDDNLVDEISAEYDISKGKAALLKNIAEVNEVYELDNLAELSVNDLNLVISNPKNDVDSVVSTGTANESAYIGKEKAKSVALEHVNITADKVKKLEAEFDYEYNRMVYDVEFAYNGYEYDYVVDATTGEVLKSRRNADDDYIADVKNKTPDKINNVATAAPKKEVVNITAKPETGTQNIVSDIGRDKAKAIALEHAGLTESQVSRLNVERDRDDGKIEYNVEFKYDNKEYEYSISGSDGRITDYDVDIIKVNNTGNRVNAQKPVSTTAVPVTAVPPTEVPATISPTKRPVEETVPTEAPVKENDIGRDRAKAIALEHAGLTESQVTRLSVERDRDDGRIEYVVEFKFDNKEHEYEISGSTGKIIDYEIEKDD